MKKKNERAVIFTVVATGVSSVAAQLLIIREFLALFEGNEFIIALTLFNWLVLGGLGTHLARGDVGKDLRRQLKKLALLSLLLAVLPSFELLAIRLLRDRVFIPGASVGFYPTLAYTFFTMAPYALLVGFALPFSLKVLRGFDAGIEGTRIYLADNAGDVCGGALFSFVLVYFFSPLGAAAVANVPLLLAAFMLLKIGNRRVLPAIGWLVLAALLLAGGWYVERASLSTDFGQLALYRETRFGRLTVYRQAGQATIFEDGVPSISSQTPSLAEELAHFPLSQLQTVGNVLAISVSGGVIQAMLAHDPNRIDLLELNPEIIKIQQQFDLLPSDPAVRVIHQDGRAFLENTPETYDAIVLGLPEPNTFQVNRFFTDQFFELAKSRLTPDGVLAFSMQGYDNYLGKVQREKLACLHRTAAGHFSHALLLPGLRVHCLYGQRPLSSRISALLEQKNIATDYLAPYFDGNVTEARIAELNALVQSFDAALNTDLRPHLIRLMFSQWFEKFATSPAAFMMVLGLGGLIYLFRVTRAQFVLFTTGFISMGSEIVVIFAFQIFYGYIYFQIGLIVTVFLAGLLPGAWLAARWPMAATKALAYSDLLLILLLGGLLSAVAGIGAQLPAFFFLAIGLVLSLVCGFQFPKALQWQGDHQAGAVATFSADLAGAAFGTLLTSVVLIPYGGLIVAMTVLMALKMISMAMVGRRS